MVEDKAAPVISNAPSSVNENTATVGSATVTGGSDFTYTLSGTDAALFEVDANGEVTFKVSPDYENPTDADGDNVYDVVLEVKNADGEATFETLSFTVEDLGPAVTAKPSAIDENKTSAGQVQASGTGLSYSLSGTDASLFEIDANGEITFKASPDYENPTDADGDNSYELELTITDASGETKTEAVTIVVEDKATPVVSGLPTSVTENTKVVGTATVTGGSDFTYTLGGADAALFEVDANGQISFKSDADFEAPTDSDADNTYDLTLEVKNSDGEVVLETLSVAVQDLGPAVTSTPDSINENSTAVGKVNASGTGLSFSLASGDDANLFEIDASTGDLSFKAAPDFESPADADAKNDYHVTVVVADASGETMEQIVSISVQDLAAPTLSSLPKEVNENTTTVGSVSVSGGSGFSYELTGADAALFTVDASGQITLASSQDFEGVATDADGDKVFDLELTVTNADGESTTESLSIELLDQAAPAVSGLPSQVDENATTVGTASVTGGTGFTYALSGDDKDLFEVDANGQISFKSAPDYEAAANDADGDRVYAVSLVVTNAEGEVTTESLSLALQDLGPTVNSTPDSVNENVTAVGSVDASGTGLSYGLSGADASLFEIDANGAISFKTSPDYESPTDTGADNSYEVTVTVTDSDGETRQENITIAVADQAAPAVSGLPSQVDENATTVGTASVTGGTGFTYALSGDDKDLFEVDANGQISFKSAPDYEAAANDADGDRVYAVSLVVTNAEGEVTTASLSLALQDLGPTALTGLPVSFAENETTVGTASTTADTSVTYSLSGADAGLFKIDAAGQLTLDAAQNFENAGDSDGDGTYDVTIRATDANSEYTETTYALTLTDVLPLQASDFVTPAEAGNADSAYIPIDTTSDFINEFVESGRYSFSSTLALDNLTGNGAFNSGAINGSLSLVTRTLSLSGNVNFNDGSADRNLSFQAGTRKLSDYPGIGSALTFGFSNDGSNGAQFTQGRDQLECQGCNGNLEFLAQLTPGTTSAGKLRFNTSLNLQKIEADNSGSIEALGVATVSTLAESTQSSLIDSFIDENTTEVVNASRLPDSGQTYTYAITGGADANLFQVDPSTGVVTTVSSSGLDYETWDQTAFEFDLSISNADSTEVFPNEVRLQDVGPLPSGGIIPQITEGDTSIGAIEFIGDPQTNALCTDCTYALSGTDASYFSIDPNTGVLSLASALDFENPQDANADNNYEVTVTATDSAGEQGTEDLTFEITDRPQVEGGNIFQSNEWSWGDGTYTPIGFDEFDLRFSEGGKYDFSVTFNVGDKGDTNGTNNVSFDGAGSFYGTLNADSRTLSATVDSVTFTENGSSYSLTTNWSDSGWDDLKVDPDNLTQFVLPDSDRASYSCTPACSPSLQAEASVIVGGATQVPANAPGSAADYFTMGGSVSITPDATKDGVAESGIKALGVSKQ